MSFTILKVNSKEFLLSPKEEDNIKNGDEDFAREYIYKVEQKMMDVIDSHAGDKAKASALEKLSTAVGMSLSKIEDVDDETCKDMMRTLRKQINKHKRFFNPYG